jgi:phosphohistidine phosphatase
LKHEPSERHKDRDGKPLILWVLRHAIAIAREDPECPADPLRALTPRGRSRQQESSEGLRLLGLAPERIITSPYLRARETAEIVAAVIGFPRDAIEESESLEPGEDPVGILGELRARPTTPTLLCGHAPHLDRLIARVIGAPVPCTELKRGGVACLELPGGPSSSGTLRWLMTPRSLRRLAIS